MELCVSHVGEDAPLAAMVVVAVVLRAAVVVLNRKENCFTFDNLSLSLAYRIRLRVVIAWLTASGCEL